MRTDKDIAFAMRREGKSYNEICSKLGMSTSTLSNWFKGKDFSEEIRKNLTKNVQVEHTIRLQKLNKVRGDTLAALYERARAEAKLEMEKHIHNPLFVSAIAAYWGEGDKLTKNQLRLTNTDPGMLKIFMRFLAEICGIEKNKIRGALFVYEDLNQNKCEQYWKSEIGDIQFHKTMVLPSRHKTRRLPHGICTIVVSNTYLKHKMLFWIDQLPKMVLNGAPKK